MKLSILVELHKSLGLVWSKGYESMYVLNALNVQKDFQRNMSF